MANVVTVEHGDGSVSAGFDADGTFVPFATVSAHRIAQLQERASNLSERLKSNDPEDVARAQEAVEQLPVKVKTTRGKKTENTEEGGGE